MMELAGYYVPDLPPPEDPKLVRALRAAQATLHKGDSFMQHLQETEAAIINRAVTAAWEVFKEDESEAL